MATKEVLHKFGKLNFEFDDARRWTDGDQQLANHLQTATKDLEAFANDASKLTNEASEFGKLLKDREELHAETGVNLKAAREKADRYIGELELKRPNLSDELCEVINIASDAIQMQNASIRNIHQQYCSLNERANKLQGAFEELCNRISDEERALFAALVNDEAIATELCSFDDACQELCALMSHYGGRVDAHVDYVHSVVDRYNELSLRVEWQQDVWTELCSRLVLIEYIGKLNSGKQEIILN
ncbi:MAG: hypothetical protein K9G41_06235 [Flavobacteriales bacterium]|nr:hypothetical protein [Flavobacteriales bacterium]